jgi:hypothetical protein
MTYYPGTGAVAEAQRVTVSTGQEVSEISFALTPTRVAAISGTVTTSSGKPVANEMVMLAPANPTMFFGPMSGMGRTRPDGSFTISNVAAGDYRLEARVAGETDGGPFGPGAAETASVPLTVSGRDISGLAIVTAATATATGRVVFDGGVPPGVLPGAVTVFAPPEAPMQFSLGGGPSRVRDDWTVEIRGLAGRRFIRAPGLPSGWALKSVTVNGQDVTDSVIEFKPGENLSGLEITLTQHLPSISGSVQGERNMPADDYVVVAFSSDSRRWGSQTRYVRSARPDQSGKFVLKSLPPDEYLVVAVESLETGEETDPELLEKLRRYATTVTLSEGDSKTLPLKLTRER